MTVNFLFLQLSRGVAVVGMLGFLGLLVLHARLGRCPFVAHIYK